MKPRGTSLAEALVTSFILLLVLGVVGALAAEYNHVMAFSGEKDRTLAGIDIAATMLREDLQAAIDVDTSPPLPDTLVLHRINQNVPGGRLTPNPSPLPWDAWAPAYQLEIRYSISPAGLTRKVGSETMLLASGASGLTVSVEPGGMLEVHLSFLEPHLHRVRSLRFVTLRRVGPP